MFGIACATTTVTLHVDILELAIMDKYFSLHIMIAQ
jgi:hypothetical protein